ncbi:molybdenum ABC transporter ATP-binding protein [Marinomonas transparens]|uniref:Molybdenum ABC transporter ATP-binding protein n=1 Tax=Marinomonas transparens TaxID=2795388 RepID=A0A934N237_9GAMM|nr:molybdenum ABC transporter ATP-binding protein [Marinomonas transparens]MBJ7538357.1 molybdenum ABC transporter ATP-binding protein [Marinomonas transparens]
MVNRQSTNRLEVKLTKQYSEQSGFSLDVDLHIAHTGVTALFGPSGSGKTTFLRCVAGLERSPQGTINLNNEIWQSRDFWLPTHQRPIGYVFQEASLFPHLTADENLQFAIKRANKSHAIITYDEVIALMNIEPILSQYPQQLSGGERQRVAIARALLIQPQLLLMDEPLAGLDDVLKQEILPYLEQLCRRCRIPILYVSHSLDEVIRLADYMVVLNKGKVVEQGETQNLLGTLGTSFSKYQDASVLISGTVEKQESQWTLSWMNFGSQHIVFKQGNEQLGDTVRLRVQSKDVSLSLSKHNDSSILNKLSVVVDDMEEDQQDPSMVMVRVLAESTPILARITSLSAHNLKLKKGQSLIAQIKSVAVLS